MDELKKLWTTDQLKFYGSAEKYHNHYIFKELIDSCYDKEWIPYCKKTFNGAQSVIAYLGKYTHRIAVSNHRIICMDEKTVTFSVKDYNNKSCSFICFLKPQNLRFYCRASLFRKSMILLAFT